MAEEIDTDASGSDETPVLGRRSRRQVADRQGRGPRAARVSGSRPRRRGGVAKPARTVVVVAMVGGLIVAAGLPAYAAWNPGSGEKTVEQLAADNSQSLLVASTVTTSDLSRGSYSATTADELAAKKAAEAAAAAAARAASSSAASVPASSVNLNMVAPGSGQVRWPLDMSQIIVGRGLGADGYHQGVDLLGAFGTYEYAAAAGTVSFAGWSGGYGQVVFIDHVINGVSVSTAYAHMSTVLVSQGQTVTAGQVIGLMGMTGSATANHLHFEVRVNGGIVDPYAWLQQNAG